jgi:hypothetical protein
MFAHRNRLQATSMTTDAEYRQRVSRYTAPEIFQLWQQVQVGETPDWDAGKALEYLVLRAFELEGADVTYPFSVQVGGVVVEQIDGVVYTNGLSCLVECKDRNSNLAIDPVAKLRNQLLRRPFGAIGVVFSTMGFTEATQILAQYSTNQAILLWDGSELDYALPTGGMCRGLVRKYRYCIERGVPTYNLAIEEVP